MLLKNRMSIYKKLYWNFTIENSSAIRQIHDKTKPLVYPVDLDYSVNKLNVELTNNQNKKTTSN